LETL